MFLHQRWVYSKSAENCNLGFTTIQIPTQQGKKNSLIEEEIKVGRATLSRESMAFHWVLAWKEECFFFLLDSAIRQGVRAPLLVFQLYLIEISVFLFTKARRGFKATDIKASASPQPDASLSGRTVNTGNLSASGKRIIAQVIPTCRREQIFLSNSPLGTRDFKSKHC